VYVCLCHAATTRDIDAAIDDGATTVEEIGDACGAGTGCGACVGDIEARLACAAAREQISVGTIHCSRSVVPVRLKVLTEPRRAA